MGRPLCGDVRAAVWPVVIAFFASALAAPSALADEPAQHVSGEGRVDGASRLVGSLNGTLVTEGAFLDAASRNAGFGLGAHVANGRLVVLNFQVTKTGTSDRSPSGQLLATGHQGVQVVSDRPFEGDMLLDEVRPHGTLRIRPHEGDLVMAGLENRTVEIGAPTRMAFASNWARIGESEATKDLPYWLPTAPAGLMRAGDRGNLSFHGAFALLVTEADVVVRAADGSQETIRVETRLNESASASDPLGWAGHWTYDRLALVVMGTGNLSMMTPDSGQFAVGVSRLEGTWTGDVAFQRVEGRWTSDGKTVAQEAALVQAIGVFDVDADYTGDSGARWGVSGEATFLAVDGEPVFGTRGGDADVGSLVVATASIGGFLLAAWAVVSWFRRGLVWVWANGLVFRVLAWAPLAARVAPEKVLEHPTRQRIVEIIVASGQPERLSVVRARVAKEANGNESTIQGHVNTLVRANKMRLLTIAGTRYLCLPATNGNGIHDDVAVALLGNPTAFLIADGFRERGAPLSQGEVVAYVNDGSNRSAVPGGAQAAQVRSTIQKWLRRMERCDVRSHRQARQEVSLVRATRSGRTVRYEATGTLLQALRRHRQRLGL
jgi:hypothetical protein